MIHNAVIPVITPDEPFIPRVGVSIGFKIGVKAPLKGEIRTGFRLLRIQPDKQIIINRYRTGRNKGRINLFCHSEKFILGPGASC